jgi:hypothetical protein
VKRAACGARLLTDPHVCKHHIRVLIGENPCRYRCLLCDTQWISSHRQENVPRIPSKWENVGLDALRLYYVRWKLGAEI